MSRMTRYSLLNLLALSVALPALGQQAGAAQDAAGPQDNDRDVIVVTAQKREETVQDIAVAVTAISSQLRDEIGLTNVQDYTNFTPGFAYSSSNDRLGMRGVARNTNNFGIRSGISNYVDGVYYSSALPASRAPILVERVEIVRGPQGTLYGRDAIGGALNVISKRPSDDFEMQVNLAAGSYGLMKIEGTASGPITDSLRYRLAATRTKQDEGYFTDVATGETEGGRLDDYFLEAQLEGNFGETFDWWIRYATSSWSRLGSPGGRVNTGDKSPYDTRLAPPGATLPNAAYGFVVPGYTQIGTQTTNPTDVFQFNTDTPQLATLPHSNELALEAIYHGPGFDVKYLGGYVYYKYNLISDNDGFPVTSFPFRFPPPAGALRTILPKAESDYTENRMWYSNEINILSTHDGPLQWIAGLYQYQEDYTQPTYSYLTEAPALASAAQSLRQLSATSLVPRPLVQAPGHPGSALRTYTNNEGLNHAYGVFAQGDYSFNDQWKLTAGIRYSQDNAKTKEYGRLICYFVCGLTGATAGVVALDITDTTWSGSPATTPFPLGAPGILGATAANGFTGAFTDAQGNRIRLMKDDWMATTGVLGLDWTPDTDTLIYAKIANGYKSGGFGAATVGTNFTPLPRVDKEELISYELGFKRDFRSLGLTTNAVAFFYDYEGYQVPNTVVPEVGPAFSAFVNLPKVETTGFELETIWRATDQLRFLFNYGYLNAEIVEASGFVDAIDPLGQLERAKPVGPIAGTGLNQSRGQDLAGNILPLSPKNKIALNATYDFDFEDGSRLTPSLSYFWQEGAYSSIFNREIGKSKDWDQIDGRITWTDADGRWTFIAYVRNLMDDLQSDSKVNGIRRASTNTPLAATTALNPVACGSSPESTVVHNTANPFGQLQRNCYTTTDTYRPPRTFGVELQFRY